MPEDGAERRARVVELAKRRGFFFAANEAYGGVAGLWTYGPAGAALKRNIEQRWRERFTLAFDHMEVQSPTIMPEPVFEASGHIEDFTDWIVECPDCGHAHRADHLVEDTGEVTDAEGFPPEELATLLDDLGVACPRCGASLGGVDVDAFNLMFETSIGPGDGDRGFLRPETAQGMFVDFPRLAEYARGQLPFGVTQIGNAYRNEISPRRAIIRMRELTQAELELFYDPETDDPPLAAGDDVDLRLYPADVQADDGDYVTHTPTAALEAGRLSNAWIAYFLGVSARWFVTMGVDPERLRFRQHLSDERAHYARDCWDAEVRLGDDWIELAGFADRGRYDLGKHADHTGESYTVFKPYDEPRTVERASVDPDMATLGPEYGDRAPAIASALERRVAADPETFESGAAVAVEVDGETVEVPHEVTGYAVQEETESGEHIRPHVAEPAFGIDRLLFTLLEHNYREDVVDGEARTYLALDPRVAPTLAAVLPLMDADGLPERAREVVDDLAAAGIAVTSDESGNIGRRYRRQDEVGTPFCLTVDHQTLEDDTVTLRDRDSTAQVRLPVDAVEGTLRELRDGTVAFDAVTQEREVVERSGG